MPSVSGLIPELPRPGVLVNPLSGRNRRRPVDISRLAARFDVPVREVVTQADVEDVLFEFSAAGVNLVLVSSGDGTVQAVHSSLFGAQPFDVLPPLVIVRGGTTNMTAADTGVSGDLESALERIFQKDFSSSARMVFRDIMRVEIPGCGTKYGMFLATAGICDAMAWYREHMHQRIMWGVPGIALTFIKFIFNAFALKQSSVISPRTMRISIDGKTLWEGELLILMLTTLNRLLFEMKPYKTVKRKTCSRIHVTAIKRGARKIIREVSRLLITGRLSNAACMKNGYLLKEAEQVKVWHHGEVSLDGELYPVTPESGSLTVSKAGVCPFIRW